MPIHLLYSFRRPFHSALSGVREQKANEVDSGISLLAVNSKKVSFWPRGATIAKTHGTDMPFNPDIVVTEPGSSHVLLIVEAKTNASPSQSEPKLKRYMWEMSCPVGLFVSPRIIILYRNRFTGYSDDSIHKLCEFPSPHRWSSFEGRKSGAEFGTLVQSWLEKLRKNPKAAEVPQETREALAEYVVPSLINGEIHAAGPRLTT